MSAVSEGVARLQADVAAEKVVKERAATLLNGVVASVSAAASGLAELAALLASIEANTSSPVIPLVVLDVPLPV